MVQWTGICLLMQGHVGSISGSGSFLMPRGSYACIPQLQSLSATTAKACAPRARAPKQEKPLHREAHALQRRVAPARYN